LVDFRRQGAGSGVSPDKGHRHVLFQLDAAYTDKIIGINHVAVRRLVLFLPEERSDHPLINALEDCFEVRLKRMTSPSPIQPKPGARHSPDYLVRRAKGISHSGCEPRLERASLPTSSEPWV
jgi:hypothetical protein